MSTPQPPPEAEIPSPSLEEVSQGIYAYIQPDGSWGLNNTGFITGDSGVIAIDTCFTEARTKALLEAIRSVSDRPIRTLVNTHQHGDHTNGNYQLPAATIIGHELCRQGMLEMGLPTVNPNPMYSGVQWGNLRLAPPFVTFEDKLTIYSDDLKIDMRYVGPAHTTNDIIAWIPERKLLFAGDLLFNGGTPFVMMGSVAGSLRALEQLRAIPAETIVPGHGAVCGPELIDDMVAYLRWVQDLARRGFEKGLTPLEAAQQAELGRFADWHDKERLAGNMHRVYSELRGEPLGTKIDLKAAVTDVLTYNGGKPVRCVA